MGEKHFDFDGDYGAHYDSFIRQVIPGYEAFTPSRAPCWNRGAAMTAAFWLLVVVRGLNWHAWENSSPVGHSWESTPQNR